LSDGVAITGGTLLTSGTGTIHVMDQSVATLANLTLNGQLQPGGTSITNLVGTIDNLGTIAMLGSVISTADLRIDGAATLSGGGAVELNFRTRVTGSGTLINANNTIRGVGEIGTNTLPVINHGSIIATGDDLLLNSNGHFVNHGTQGAAADGVLTFTGQGGGSFTGAGSTIADGTIELVSAANVSTGNVSGAGTVIMNDSTQLVANHLRVKHLRMSLSGAGVATLTINPNGTDSGVSRLTTNPLLGGAPDPLGPRLDLTDNDLLVSNGSLTTIRNYVSAARHAGAWDRTGITSTAARNHPQQATTLGVMTGDEYISVHGPAPSFGPFTVASGDVLVKYTWYGDADFNGQVDFDDYVRADGGFNNGLSGWINGDFDLSGAVDFDDYVLLDLGFNAQNGTLRLVTEFLAGNAQRITLNDAPGLQMVRNHLNQFGSEYASHFLAAIPEPASALTSIVCCWATLRRRCRMR
jgi:hypothetical protein